MCKLLGLFLGFVCLSSYLIGAAPPPVNGAGATFPFPVYSAWAYQYQKLNGTKINYQPIGSGGGQLKVIEGTTDFGASDDPLTPEEVKKNNLIQFPMLIGGVVLVVNIDGVPDGKLKLDPDVLNGIFLGTITRWNDEKIAKINPEVKLPDEPITVIHRVDPSGTTAIFSRYLSQISSVWAEKTNTGKSVQFPTGIGGKGNEGVAALIKRTANSIGYVEYAYVFQLKLNYVLLKNAAGNYVTPSTKSFRDAAENADFEGLNDFYTSFVNAKGANSWPITAATYILLKDGGARNKEVVNFFDWALEKGDNKAEELKYVPLPPALETKIREYWKSKGLY